MYFDYTKYTIAPFGYRVKYIAMNMLNQHINVISTSQYTLRPNNINPIHEYISLTIDPYSI